MTSTIRAAPFVLALLSVLLGACHSTPAKLPPGRGLVSFDRDAPEGATTYAAPTWKVGDRFVYLKGGLSRLAFRLESTDAGVHRLVDEQGTMVLRIGEDLSDRGQEKPGDEKATLAYDPADFELSWPLWQGKRWTCSFTSRGAGRPDIPLLVSYLCDATEDVTVPAGTFRCLRVWRRARPAVEGNWIERISVAWYAPEAGVFVKRLADSLLTELAEVQRQ
jgi:hypothetical protein